MGNHAGKQGFEKWELGLLEKMFEDLSHRSPGKNIDKLTFLHLFNLPGMVGERLFAVFDTKHQGYIDFEEFISGLRAYSRGSIDDKIQMLFKMYDLQGDNAVSPQELSMMLFSLLTPATTLLERTSISEQATEQIRKKTESTVSKIVEEAFSNCDIDHNNKLDFSEFKVWLRSKPEIMDKLEEVLIRHSWESILIDQQQKNLMLPGDGFDIRCNECGWQPKFCYICGLSLPQYSLYCSNCDDLLTKPVHLNHCMNCGSSLSKSKVDPLLLQETSPNSGTPPTIASSAHISTCTIIRQGYLYKKSLLRKYRRQWFVLTSNFFYCFHKKGDQKPSVVTLIEGCFINALESQDDPDHNFFGFEIITSDTDKIILFSTSKESRTCWVNDLRKSAKTIPITSKYTLGPQLGKGKFSVVHMGKEMSTGKRYAIKILDKSKIDQRVKEALQQEIAILNVVRHPRIVQMKEVFETQERYYIVLRLYENGDLFQYIKGLKKKLDEKCVKKIIWNLVDAVMYLHNLGIVHRDLKPENILMDDAEDCSKVVLSDFGLSKFATPEEIMGVACGTLSYVAPEVLRLNGYTKAVDYWSIGIIMYLLLSGYLPFSGKTQKDTISLTIKCDLKFTKESWNSRSEESKDLLRHLLRSDPNRRASGEKIIQHSWFDEIRSEMVDEDTVDECNELPTMSSVGARRSLDLSVSHGSLDPSGNQSTSEDEHDNVVQH